MEAFDSLRFDCRIKQIVEKKQKKKEEEEKKQNEGRNTTRKDTFALALASHTLRKGRASQESPGDVPAMSKKNTKSHSTLVCTMVTKSISGHD